jgi:IPT/TIG domain
VSGGTSVAITGTNFTGATAVKFGSANASFTVNSATLITATSPAGTGVVDVTVTVAGVTSATGASDQFTYSPAAVAPVITSVSPNPVTGSNSVQLFTIYGNNFVSGANVTLRDLTAGQTFPNRTPVIFSTTQITVNVNFTSAAHNWSVEVINPDGGGSGQFPFKVVAASPTCRLTITPPVIQQGQPATLAWTSTNASTGTIDDGIGSVDPTGSVIIYPVLATTYTGTFANAVGSTVCQAPVFVGGLVDPVPDLLSTLLSALGGNIDAAALTSKGRLVTGVSADGVTRAHLRRPTNSY